MENAGSFSAGADTGKNSDTASSGRRIRKFLGIHASLVLFDRGCGLVFILSVGSSGSDAIPASALSSGVSGSSAVRGDSFGGLTI